MKHRNKFRNPLKFTKSINGVKPKKNRVKLQRYIIISLIIVLLFLGYNYVERQLWPTVIAMANMKIQTMATTIINQSVDETLRDQNINTEELITYHYNEKNEIISLGVNTVLVNKLSAGIVEKITNEVDKYKDESIEIPLGNVVGGGVFADSGPNFKVDIMPYGTTKINYDKEFSSTGINQINYRIWLDIEIAMQVMVPLDTEGILIRQQITLVDRVINGDIPEHFVNVPEDNILDVAP